MGAITIDGKLCIGDMSLRKYMPRYIIAMGRRNKITCQYETFISDMLLQSDLNKLRVIKIGQT